MSDPNCQYQGYEFGAHYPDSMCIDGYLWDADSCDEPGGPLYSGGEIPCPRCNTKAFLQYALDDVRESECGVDMCFPWCGAVLWEGAIAKARRENVSAADTFLQTVEPFEAFDWPNRQAVYDRRARWDETIIRKWPWPLPTPAKSGQTETDAENAQ